ncbi:thioesterase II family protein [Streptomyces hainanensis]|uniref:Thioesterase n=1 Tax=Streptomyces hainanensis TaxID=402648 RepID=A0A4R4TCX2_9ACTN|nr:alpha/beta fold hydrolase [Streptomyces hainanensis]TDC72673.1 thioesterase [Streptomyces hainanensis]
MRNPWVYRSPTSGARTRLFCFPYAGGTAAAYRGWQEDLPGEVEVCAVEPPGRRVRHREPAIRRMPELVDAAVAGLAPLLDRPFALFGHSLGALVAYEVARALPAAGLPTPDALFLSGAAAPHLPRPGRRLSGLPDAEFLAELRDYGGTPTALLADPELIGLFLPTLRADFEVFETYAHQPGHVPACPTHLYGGQRDHRVIATQLRAWRALSPSVAGVRMFPGGHFYLHEDRTAVTDAVAGDLAGLASATSGAVG